MPKPSLFVLRAGAIGDFVLTIPALSALRHKFPAHRIILAARADVLPLVHGTLADDVMPFDSALLTPLFLSGGDMPAELQTRLGEIDLAVVWLSGNAARTVADNLRRLDVGRLLSADPLPNRQHATEHLLSTLAPLGIGDWHTDTAPFVPATLPLTAPWQAAQHVVSIHVGSGGVHKRWPRDRFLTLADRLRTIDGIRVVLFSGPAEETGITRSLPNPLIRSVIPADLPELASMLRHSALYIGNDSGPTHLAAALGVPTIALFGPTDPMVWGPRGRHVTIVQSPDRQMEGISLDVVWQRAAHALRGDTPP